MQIILASAKIMDDSSATKGDACQSKKVKSSPDISPQKEKRINGNKKTNSSREKEVQQP